jgi:hypothetical protein
LAPAFAGSARWWKAKQWFTVERSGSYPMSINKSKLIKHAVSCAN